MTNYRLKTFNNKINKFFQIDTRKSTIKKEIIGGLSTFLAMMYILAVNPSMLSSSDGLKTYENAEAAIFLGTAISSFVATFIMGLFANVPIALAPGMGINAFFTFTVASEAGFGMDYFQALVCVFISGLLYMVIAITPARKKINQAMPTNMKLAIAIMIGFFLAYVGLTNIGIVSSGLGTPTEIGSQFNSKQNANYHVVIVGTITLIIGIILHYSKVKYSIIITAVIGLVILLIAYGANPNLGTLKENIKLKPYQGFGEFGSMLTKAFSSNNWGKTLSNPLSYVAIFTFLYVDFFDTSGSLFALGKGANLDFSDNKETKRTWIEKANYVDGGGTVFGSIMLNSSVTTFVESGAGISAGSRTGLSSIVTATLFLLSIAIWPLMGPLMPIGNFQPITGPAIVLTGLLMISQIKYFDFKKYIDIPVLGITVLFGMLGYSISIGFSFGIFFYVSLHLIMMFKEFYKERKKNKSHKLKLSNDLNYMLLGLYAISIIFIIVEILTKSQFFNV